MSSAMRGWYYLWAAPVTLLGLVLGTLALATGGWLQPHSGVLEFHGGFVRWCLRLPFVRAQAMTLGHVVLGRDLSCLDATRGHERVHVRQTEILGPLFLPAYLGATLWAVLRGRHYYRDNWFERDAERRCKQLGSASRGMGKTEGATGR